MLQVEAVVEEAGRLAGLFPDARDHIEVKHEETLDSWTTLLEKSEQRRDKLQQAEQLQTYFDQYRELLLVNISFFFFTNWRCYFYLSQHVSMYLKHI